MENKLIWVLNLDNSGKYLDLELYVGRNKYTKSGLFSGPLRRNGVDGFLDDRFLMFLQSLDNVAQVGKNKYKLHEIAVAKLLNYFQEQKIDEVYCLINDKKLHHIIEFVPVEQVEVNCKYWYDNNSSKLFYLHITDKTKDNYMAEIANETGIEPEARLYAFSDNQNVRGLLSFMYGDSEIPANSLEEEIRLGDRNIFRNLLYETKIKELIISVGGRKSIRNEFLFKGQEFYEYEYQRLLENNIRLFWGKERKTVSPSRLSCSISYGVDWFLVSGKIVGNGTEYTLSELLRKSKGKSFVEIDNGIVFLPRELTQGYFDSADEGSIRLPSNRIKEIVSIGEKFNLNPKDYLSKLLDFSCCNYSIPAGFDCKLKPYQKEGVKWFLNLYMNGFGCCLADDMGLGKTLQAIAFVCSAERNNKLPVLIVVPKIVLYNWKKEFEKFAPWQNVIIAYGGFGFSNLLEDNMVYITTYDTLINHWIEFYRINYDVIIIDESQIVKNFRTKRYRAIQKLKTNFHISLTGTPIENSIEELWSLFNLINPGLLGSHGQFMSKFRDVYDNPQKLNVLKKIVAPFVLRRTKEKVLKELPSKDEIYVYCEMAEAQKKLYDLLLSSARKEISLHSSRYFIKDNSIILQALLYLRETCSDPSLLPPTIRNVGVSESCKYELFKEYAKRVMAMAGKLIVYGMFPKVLKKMENWCKKQDWNTFYIDGSVTNRQKIVEDFENANQGVFFISLKAGGVGLNLVSCQYVFIYDPWWNIAAEQQAANRVYRIGQKHSVFIYHFLVKDTIEEQIYNLQKKKEKLSEDILSKLDGSTNITMKELYGLLL